MMIATRRELSMVQVASIVVVAAVAICGVEGFAPTQTVRSRHAPTTITNMVPVELINDVATTTATSLYVSGVVDTNMLTTTASTMMNDISASSGSSSSMMMSFTDQGQNLAGIFFQASLLPYLLFLYFLQFRANRIPAVGNFGFQFVLLFVMSTIPAGIISKSVYGTSLANVDWLHGGAELLLTVANILIAYGFKEAATNPEGPPSIGLPRTAGLAAFFGCAVIAALGVNVLGAEAHTGFLLGIGDLSADTTMALPWVTHSEPINALTIPTWFIHFSSVLEFLVAMELVWKFSEATNNEKWKGLTWGMLPLHASGICACTYHFFYNASVLQFLVSMQAGLTLLGNITCMIAAYRIARSNGWNLDEVNPFPRSDSDPRGLVADGIAATPLVLSEPVESNQVLAAKVIGATVALSYLVKYGSLGIDLPFEPNSLAALAMVVGIPGITAYQFYQKGNADGTAAEGEPFSFSFGDTSLSMTDVKKYGKAGIVAYVLTELAFWIVAFPVASTALYQSTGHWPDVINDTGDRTAVLAFIFAGANVARALVPLRLGAALALAPWVDENIFDGTASTTTEEA
mmetsp:Transcript_58037/g.141845  ORF Transcript_58037/g.141845 Transcript_58037/m.141845 type:complete len:574 (+) Transcript_58037:52-1773(+)